MLTFTEKFHEAFGGIIKKYDFLIKEISSQEIILKKDNFALIVYCYRENIEINYVRRTKNSADLVQCVLGYFLTSRRKWMPSYKSDKVEAQLEAYALTLENSASDILSGDDTWLKEIKSFLIPVPKPTEEEIGF